MKALLEIVKLTVADVITTSTDCGTEGCGSETPEI